MHNVNEKLELRAKERFAREGLDADVGWNTEPFEERRSGVRR